MRLHIKRVGLFGAAFLLIWAPALLAVPFDPGRATQDPGAQGPEAQAMAYLRANQPGPAIELLKKAIAKEPNSARLHYHLGLAYSQAGKPDLAEAEFKTVLQEDADFVEAHLRLAELAMAKVSAAQPKAKNLALMEAAANELKQAIKKNPQETQPYYNLATTYLRSARFREKNPEVVFDEAVRVLEEVAKRSPEEARPHSALGNVLMSYADFIAGGKKLSELPDDKARKCTALYDRAKANCEKALAVEPRAMSALNQIAAIHYNRGDLKAAVKTFEDHIPKLETPLDKATCYRRMAQYLILGDDLSRAEARLNTAIKTEPKEFASYLFLANVLTRRNLPDQAVDTLARAVKLEPNFINAHVELGMQELRRRKNREAATHFAAALNIAPDRAIIVSAGGAAGRRALFDLYVHAATELGNIHIAQSEFDQAIAVYQRLAAITPQSPVPEFLMGEAYRRKGEPDTAKDYYANALRRDKNYVRARGALAELAVAGAQTASNSKERAALLERAIAQYELALKSRPDNALIYDRVALIRIRLAGLTEPKNRSVLEEALANAEKAVELAPGAPSYRGRLAFIYRELGRTREAVAEVNRLVEDAKKAAEKEPDNVTIIYQLADLRATLHSWRPNKATFKQALDGFRLVVEKNPKFYVAYVRAGAMLYDEKDYKGAVELYEGLFQAVKGKDSIKELPADRARQAMLASAQLAWIYCDRLNDLKQAKHYVDFARQLDPTHPSLIDTIGWIHYKSGEYGQAIMYLRRAFKALPKNATIGYHLGAALVEHKNPARAREVLQEAIKHVGDDRELKAKITKLLKTVGG